MSGGIEGVPRSDFKQYDLYVTEIYFEFGGEK